MTYNVFGGTLNLAQSIMFIIYQGHWIKVNVTGVKSLSVYAGCRWSAFDCKAILFRSKLKFGCKICLKFSFSVTLVFRINLILNLNLKKNDVYTKT